MIIVFGSISMALHFDTKLSQEEGFDISYAKDYKIFASGRGANQAIAAARSEAKVTLVGKVGHDDFANSILRNLRQQSVITSGIAQGLLPTGIEIHVHSDDGTNQCIINSGANSEAETDQIPEEVLNADSFLMLQSEIHPELNAAMLEKAKRSGVTTIMNLAPSIDLSQKALNNLDYLIVNRKEASKLAIKMGLDISDDTPMQMAIGFAKLGKLTCIITMGDKGCVSARQDHSGWVVPALQLGDDFIDHNGADDAFCGTFVASLSAGLQLPRALKRASVAASLTGKKMGIQDAFPSIEEIEKELEKLIEPEKIKL